MANTIVQHAVLIVGVKHCDTVKQENLVDLYNFAKCLVAA